MNWIKLIQSLVPVAVSIAEAAHPGPDSGPTKLQTATSIITGTIGALASATSSPPPPAAVTNPTALGTAISAAVAMANALGGVQKHGPSSIPQ